MTFGGVARAAWVPVPPAATTKGARSYNPLTHTATIIPAEVFAGTTSGEDDMSASLRHVKTRTPPPRTLEPLSSERLATLRAENARVTGHRRPPLVGDSDRASSAAAAVAPTAGEQRKGVAAAVGRRASFSADHPLGTVDSTRTFGPRETRQPPAYTQLTREFNTTHKSEFVVPDTVGTATASEHLPTFGRRKGVTEFADLTHTFARRDNVLHRQAVKENPRAFARHTGMFSDYMDQGACLWRQTGQDDALHRSV